MTTECSLRDIEEGDIEWLYELHEQSYRDVVVRQFGSWDESFQRDWFDRKWQKDRPARIVTIKDDPIGVVVLEHKDDHDWLDEILIEADHRAQGVGSSLMKQFIANARAQNRPLRLQVLHENDRGKRFYENLGFVVQKNLENHYLMEID